MDKLIYTLEDLQEGRVFLVDKPLDWTSFDVVNKIRWGIKKAYGLKKIKVGHAGTLDPKATGLLIVCVGKATKTIDQWQAQDKVYTGVIKLGATTPSYDTETLENQTMDFSTISIESIYGVAQSFVGAQMQIPPMYSAIQQDGKRLYELARQNQTAIIKARPIEIMAMEITTIDLPLVHFKVHCSKGTYIRSLANDFGKRLNNLGYLVELRRESIGDLSLDDPTQTPLDIYYFEQLPKMERP